MVHRFGYSLEPLSGVRLLGEVGHFVSLDQDPQLILELTNGKVKSGWMNLTLLLELPENHSDTVFYFDNGQGFKESNKTTIPLFNNELTETQFEIPTGTKRIRFDPCDCTGEFRIKVFNLKPITQISLLRKAIKSSTRNITSIQSLVSITKKGYSLLKTGGLNALAEKIYDPSSESYTLWVKRYDTLNEADRFAIKKSVSTFTYTPLISVVMPTYNTQEKWLRAAIESVQAQLYENWELCIADDCSADENVRKIIKECAAEDSRIKYVFREVNGHISAASNSALSIATGEFVALLDHDDLLAETALYRVAQALNQNPSYDIIYSDEDKVDEDNCRYDPYFKPDWNPDLLVAQNYLSHLSIIRKSMLNEFGGFRVGFEGSQDWDMALRITRSAPANSIIHIPYILYHWRAVPGSTAKAVDQKAYITESQYKTIESHFKALQIPVEIKQNEINYWNVNYPIPDPQPLVSIIIPTKNQKVLLEKCINSIVTKTDYSNYEIIVIDNHSDEDEAKTYLRSILANPIIKVLEFKENFNFSRINNYAVSQAKGDLIVFMNNDIEILANDWLIEMLSLAIRDGTGAVGAKLLYPNKTIQHAGVILGVGGVANHAYLGAPADVVGQMGRARIVQNMSAVTAACLVVEKKKFLEVGGFNEIDLKIAFNDVDFCLKLLKAGYRNVWTPNSVFIHHESISRGQEDTPAKQARFASEVQYMLDNWKDILVNDPAYNPNLSIQRADFSLAFPPRVSRV
jgi:glycosyltransferase involved in cell wall biosynthesis